MKRFMRPIRIGQNSINIGTRNNKISIFPSEKRIRIQIGIDGIINKIFGYHCFHFGNWD